MIKYFNLMNQIMERNLEMYQHKHRSLFSQFSLIRHKINYVIFNNQINCNNINKNKHNCNKFALISNNKVNYNNKCNILIKM